MKANITDRAKSGRNGVQLCYVLDCIRNSSRAADEGLEFNTDAEALQFFFDTFNEEFNYQQNKRRYPNLQERIGEYLRGLPSCCAIDYKNCKILTLGVTWGVLSDINDKKGVEFLARFFNICGLRILQAAQKVGLNPYKYAV